MKTVIIEVFCLIAAVSGAATVAVAPLPAPEYADKEVSTNVCLGVTQELSAGDNRCFFDVSLSLVTTPTNNVEIAFGVDTDGDGGAWTL